MDPGSYSELAVRLETAGKAMTSCMLCRRRCGTDRMRGRKGYCGLDARGYCFRQMVVDYEEEGLNPSHQVYFTGCNLRCDFCSVAEYNSEPCGVLGCCDTATLAQEIVKEQKKGARTLNLLGGEPTVNLYAILGLLAKLPVTTRVVWNSNMYYEGITGKLIDGLVDIYLADFKCGNDVCAKRLLDGTDYTRIVQQNISQAAARKQTIVRHVLIPGHFECCTRPILKWLSESVPEAMVSIKGDYIPPADSEISPLEYVSGEDLKKAMALAAQMGLETVK